MDTILIGTELPWRAMVLLWCDNWYDCHYVILSDDINQLN